jgi:hypothetical protein
MMENKDDIEEKDEPWYEHEDCEGCCNDEHIEYEANFTWENGGWTCDNCGRLQ